MEVSFAHRLGRFVCGTLLCSTVSLAAAADSGSIVFVDDEGAASSSGASNGSFVVVNEASQAETKSARAEVKVAPQEKKSRQVAARRSTERCPQKLDEAGQLLIEAHNASTCAKTETDLSEVIDKSIAALRLGVKGENKKFATQLISWSLNRRGQVYADADKPELADADFEEALHFDPSNWRAQHNRGVSYAEAGKFAEAFDDFNRVIETNPKFAKAYTNRATLFVQAGDLESAEEDYKKACQLDKKLVSARLGLARACHLSGRWDEALEHFTAAAKLDPENPGILCSRGDLLADMGEYSEALASYALAIEVKPSFGHAYRNGAWLLATCPNEEFRDPKNAILGAKQALETEYGERHVALDTLAAALASAGEFDEAITTLEEAIELAPSGIRADYVARVKLYETGQPFRTQPVADVSQAVYEESDGE
ncbi:MAG: tetratricopeptide repeat protein [Bythopirellula sp.]|nr:tetratricopeptide repeat protein [Bythopirellula sp.]